MGSPYATKKIIISSFGIIIIIYQQRWTLASNLQDTMEEFLDVMVVSIATICGEYYYPFVCQEYPFEWEQVDGESKRSSWFVLDGDRYVFHTFFFLKWFFLIVFVVVVVCLYLFILFVCLLVSHVL
jgi:ABC-type multidrug transport system permease subunit